MYNGACLVDPYDVASIREGIFKVINDASYRRRLIQNGFENGKRFRSEKTAAQDMELYKQIINEQLFSMKG
jgi:glycosyltransferase involved in cell wall biosynthesis